MNNHKIHCTEITYRVCIVDTELHKDLQEKIKEAVAEYYRKNGKQNQVGRLKMGDYRVFRAKEGQLWEQKAYHYAKFSFDNEDDNNALLEIRYLPYRDTTIRFLPNLNFEEVHRKFESPKHNFYVKSIPQDWTHADLYEVMKSISPAQNSILASKISMKFEWEGMQDEPSAEIKQASRALHRSPQDAEIIDDMIQEFRENGKYRTQSNKYGYVAFNNEVTNFEDLKSRFNANPKVQQFKLQIEQFDKEKKLNRLTKVFFKNFPASWTPKEFQAFVTKSCGDCKINENNVFIAKHQDGSSRRNGIIEFTNAGVAQKVID